MAESLKEVIAKLKNNRQNSQQQTAKPVEEKPTKKEVDPIEDSEEEDFDEDEETAKETKEIKTDPSEEQIMLEIEMLQNNGRFRAELLHQMQEINKALVVIAGVLVDLSSNGKK